MRTMTGKLTQNILVPTDFSHASELALDAAAILARQNDAGCTLVHVFDPTWLAGRSTDYLPGEGADISTLEPEVERRIHDKLRELAERRVPNIDCKTALVLAHNAAAGICDYAKKEGADMIVLSTHGRSGLSHLLIGSVAEKVVRHAPCPVLTLRSKAHD